MFWQDAVMDTAEVEGAQIQMKPRCRDPCRVIPAGPVITFRIYTGFCASCVSLKLKFYSSYRNHLLDADGAAVLRSL